MASCLLATLEAQWIGIESDGLWERPGDSEAEAGGYGARRRRPVNVGVQRYHLFMTVHYIISGWKPQYGAPPLDHASRKSLPSLQEVEPALVRLPGG